MPAKPTSKDLVAQLEALKLKADALSSVITGFRGVDNLEQALSSHNIALEIRAMMEKVAVDSKNVQQPVPLEDGERSLAIVGGYKDSLKNLLDEFVSRKALYASLPIANLSALVAQDLKDIYVSYNKAANAMIDHGPDDQSFKERARALRDEIDGIFKKALVAHQ